MDDFLFLDEGISLRDLENVPWIEFKSDGDDDNVAFITFIYLPYNNIMTVYIPRDKREDVYDLSNFKNLQKIGLYGTNPNYFRNIPSTIHHLNLKNLNNVNQNLLRNITHLNIRRLEIPRFLENIHFLPNLKILTVGELVGTNCKDFENFVDEFSSHLSWKYINNDFKAVNIENKLAGNCGTLGVENTTESKKQFHPNVVLGYPVKIDYLKLNKLSMTKSAAKY